MAAFGGAWPPPHIRRHSRSRTSLRSRTTYSTVTFIWIAFDSLFSLPYHPSTCQGLAQTGRARGFSHRPFFAVAFTEIQQQRWMDTSERTASTGNSTQPPVSEYLLYNFPKKGEPK